MKYLIFYFFIFLSTSSFSEENSNLQQDLKTYRDLSLAIRKKASFKISLPNEFDMNFSYELDFSDPIYPMPIWSNVEFDVNVPHKFARKFYDRIFLKDGSNITLGNDFIPLTCVFIQGLDNRYSDINSPLFPKIILKVFLVANDYSCIGPINPAWPTDGGKEETWDTYFSFTIKDPTIMLPIDSFLRLRWNEFHTVLVK